MIFGEDAVKEYDSSKKLPSEKWLMDNGGVVTEKEFKSPAEYNAYIEGLNDSDGWNDYQIIQYPDGPEHTEESCETEIWMRIGTTVKGSKEEIEKILGGNTDMLARLLSQRQFRVNGETYIPATVMEEYNKEHQTAFEEKDLDFCLSLK